MYCTFCQKCSTGKASSDKAQRGLYVCMSTLFFCTDFASAFLVFKFLQALITSGIADTEARLTSDGNAHVHEGDQHTKRNLRRAGGWRDARGKGAHSVNCAPCVFDVRAPMASCETFARQLFFVLYCFAPDLNSAVYPTPARAHDAVHWDLSRSPRVVLTRESSRLHVDAELTERLGRDVLKRRRRCRPAREFVDTRLGVYALADTHKASIADHFCEHPANLGGTAKRGDL